LPWTPTFAIRPPAPSSQQHRKSDGSCADDGDGVGGVHLPVQDATLKTGRQNIAEHDEGLFIAIGPYGVKARVGVWDAHVLGLRAVDRVPQNPPAVPVFMRTVAFVLFTAFSLSPELLGPEMVVLGGRILESGLAVFGWHRRLHV
jgi:hypothetical protein